MVQRGNIKRLSGYINNLRTPLVVHFSQLYGEIRYGQSIFDGISANYTIFLIKFI